jgi:hypothetical protein
MSSFRLYARGDHEVLIMVGTHGWRVAAQRIGVVGRKHMAQKPEDRMSFWEKYQRFSENILTPYFVWSMRRKTNLVFGVIAVTFLFVFYSLS